MTLQLAIDDDLAQEARKVAESMGTSVDQLILSYLKQLTSTSDAEEIEAELAELERLSQEAKGDSQGWKFNRDELYERS
jgi:antitoxin component of RelBE/YafQ-DinJ toxin-antitoxin module